MQCAAKEEQVPQKSAISRVHPSCVIIFHIPIPLSAYRRGGWARGERRKARVDTGAKPALDEND
jgi:hypothetical protein